MNSIDIKCGYTCNSNCKFCACVFDKNDLIKNNKPIDLTTEQIMSLLYENKDKYDSCTLTGGEVTIRKDFVQILDTACNLYKHVVIQTNGRLLYRPAIRDAINSKSNLSCVINVCGSTANINDTIAQNNCAYAQLLKSLETIRPSKVTLLMVIIKENVFDMPNIVRLAQKYNIKNVSFVPIMTTDTEEGDHTSMIAPLKDVDKYLLEAYNLAKCANIIMRTYCGSFPFCKMSPTLWEIYGDLVSEVVTASIAVNEDMPFNTTTERQNVHRFKPQLCEKCSLFNICEGFVRGTEEVDPQPIIAPVSLQKCDKNIIHKLKVLSILLNSKSKNVKNN